jgi:hypothetical protein
VARKVEPGFDALREKTDPAVRALAKSKNVKLKELTADQVADWRACSAGMLADYMDKNAESAHKLMAAYRKLRTDPCCSAMPGENAFTRGRNRYRDSPLRHPAHNFLAKCACCRFCSTHWNHNDSRTLPSHQGRNEY